MTWGMQYYGRLLYKNGIAHEEFGGMALNWQLGALLSDSDGAWLYGVFCGAEDTPRNEVSLPI
jgi:hypothetical protein